MHVEERVERMHAKKESQTAKKMKQRQTTRRMGSVEG